MIVSRNRSIVKEDDASKGQKFLYRFFIGRAFLFILTRPFVSKLGGFILSTKLSKLGIKGFIKRNNINVCDYEIDSINSFNDFFCRKIKPNRRSIDYDLKAFISPCDSKLSVYKINKDSIFNIKNSYYKLSDLVNDEDLASKYIDGYALVFRLCVDDYHRYCYIDSGTKGENVHIKGIFHTVNPIALEKYNFFKTNSREYSILHTDHFSDVVQIEVGAMMVGRIDNYHGNYSFKKGEEKGKFLFGGSTIVLLVKPCVKIDDVFIDETKLGNEVIVKYGEKIGELYEDL